jgi:hypothetical protein
MAENEEGKHFRCYWCGKALATDEVVPLVSDQCCGFTASCASCADQIVERRQPETTGEATAAPTGG